MPLLPDLAEILDDLLSDDECYSVAFCLDCGDYLGALMRTSGFGESPFTLPICCPYCDAVLCVTSMITPTRIVRTAPNA
jgi:hypothetical protein